MLNVSDISLVEKFLLKNLFSCDAIRVVFAQDIWCLICRASSDYRKTAFTKILSLLEKSNGRHRTILSSLIERIFKFLSNEEKTSLSEVDFAEHRLFWTFDNLSEEEKFEKLIETSPHIREDTDTDSFSIRKLIEAAHIVGSMKQNGQSSPIQSRIVHLILYFAGHGCDKLTPQMRCSVESACLEVSKHVSFADVVGIVSDDSYRELFVVNILTRMVETIAVNEISTSILQASVRRAIATKSPIMLQKWMHFFQLFAIYTNDFDSVLEHFGYPAKTTPERLKSLFHRYIANVSAHAKVIRLLISFFRRQFCRTPK